MTDTIEKIYWTIGEVASELDEPDYTVRLWDNHFNVSSKRSWGRYRRFTISDLEKMRTIKHLLRVRRFTIEGAKLELSTL